MSETTNDNDQAKRRRFCGLQALISRLKNIATYTAGPQAFDEIFAAVEELQRLDQSLSRVKGLSSIDKEDLDRAIDFWRRGA